MSTQAAIEAHRARRAHRIAQIEADLALGISPSQIAGDLGVTVAALERQMHRAGRHDLATRLYRERA